MISVFEMECSIIFFIYYFILSSIAIGDATAETCSFFSQNDISGDWVTNNNCGETKIYSIDSIELGLATMQVWILARGVINSNKCNRIDLYLIDPIDLGSGGRMLSWENFSRTKPIGWLDFISDHEMLNNWEGFYDEKQDTLISHIAYDWICNDTLFKSGTDDNAEAWEKLPDPEMKPEFYENKWLVIIKTELKKEKCKCENGVILNSNHFEAFKSNFFVCIAGAFTKQSEAKAFSRMLKTKIPDNYIRKTGKYIK